MAGRPDGTFTRAYRRACCNLTGTARPLRTCRKAGRHRCRIPEGRLDGELEEAGRLHEVSAERCPMDGREAVAPDGIDVLLRGVPLGFGEPVAGVGAFEIVHEGVARDLGHDRRRGG